MSDKLGAYRAKRRFEQTAEPRAGVAPPRKRNLRFVVQRHAARRLHYDLRLEWGGVLKSWAVTRGPSLDPADKRLAVETEDHPLAYASFEGIIPEGQYGAGTVEIWDRGVWAPLSPNSVDTDLQAGKLKFVLAGERLRGGFTLVLMRGKPIGDDKRRNWLLIKEADSMARPGAEEPAPDVPASVASGRRVDEIGRASSAFVPPQLCEPVETPPRGAGWVHELKLDGYRIQIGVRHGEAAVRTRTGLDWTQRFPTIARAASMLPDVVLDGETVVLDADGRTDFAALQAYLAGTSRTAPIAFVFDLLAEGGVDWRSKPLLARKARLEEILASRDTGIRYLAHFTQPGEAVLHSACRLALEGIVSKQAMSPYRGGRHASWTKTKCRGRDEFVVGGWTSRKDGGGIGALLVGAQRDGALLYLGRVGTGFSERTSAALTRALQGLRRATSPFAGRQPAVTSDVTWVEPALVAEVRFGGWTEEGLLRHASFVAWREDKLPQAVLAPAVATPRKASPRIVQPKRGDLTNPNRVLWPAEAGQPAITKEMLAAYYAKASALLLKHVAGKPLSLLRMPDGLGGQSFFQKHPMPGQPATIRQIAISGRERPYLMVDDAEGLLALAQLSVMEIHPWGALSATPDAPERLVFDIDPPDGTPFEAIAAAAMQLRSRLQPLGLTSFARLSGGKGVHVVVPLARDRGVGWAQAKMFARTLCAKMEQDTPALYTTAIRKASRGGRIFLDFLRNDREATAIASWSPRARPGAPIAQPLSWQALARHRPRTRLTLPEAMASRLVDPWKDFENARSSLREAIRRLLQH